MIDMSKIKVGDEVTVRAKVVASGNVLNGLSSMLRRLPVVRIAFTEWVGADEIEAHHPAPREFKPGDRVTCGQSDPLTIAAIDGGLVWVKETDGEHFTVLMKTIRHADESE